MDFRHWKRNVRATPRTASHRSSCQLWRDCRVSLTVGRTAAPLGLYGRSPQIRLLIGEKTALPRKRTDKFEINNTGFAVLVVPRQYILDTER